MVAMIALNRREALRRFWDAGYDNENRLRDAAAILDRVPQPAAGYYYPADIDRFINMDRIERTLAMPGWNPGYRANLEIELNRLRG